MVSAEQIFIYVVTTGFAVAAGLTIDSNYCQVHLDNNADTKYLAHKESVTLTYSGDQTSGSGDFCGYKFHGGSGSLGESYELQVTPVTFNITNCAVTAEYWAFLSMSLSPTKVYDCNNQAMSFKTKKTTLMIGIKASTTSSSRIEFKISAVDLTASGVSGLESTIQPMLLAGLFVALKILF